MEYRDKYKNIIIQRINECDERKTNHVNQQIINISKNVNGCIYVSSWLKSIFSKIDNKNQTVIKNGADDKILQKNSFTSGQKIKIVTHHFSNNYLKGFKFYKQLDDILSKIDYSSRFEFTSLVINLKI